jgi:hypothetical protein
LIVVVASRFDASLRGLGEAWSGRSVRFLTSEDLSLPGWRYYGGGAAGAGRAVIGGHVVRADEITGVLTRTTGVWEGELIHIEAKDRAYVAAEMSAFLMAWLSALDCPVLNRPVPGSLAGPCWRPEQWATVAARAELRVRSDSRSVRLGHPESLRPTADGVTTVTVVGRRCISAAHETLTRQARRLADAAEIDLLSVHFSGADEDAWFVGADTFPSFASAEVMNAVAAYFDEPGPWSLRRRYKSLGSAAPQMPSMHRA